MSEVLSIPKKFTAEQAAELLGISVATLHRERTAGRIRAYRPGNRRIYYLENELAAYVERATDGWDAESSTPDRLETIGSPSGQARRSGTGRGSTAIEGKHDAKASALRALRAPKRR